MHNPETLVKDFLKSITYCIYLALHYTTWQYPQELKNCAYSHPYLQLPEAVFK